MGKTFKFIPNGSLVAENGPFECRLLGWAGSGHYDLEYCRSFHVAAVRCGAFEVILPLPAQPSRRHSNGLFSATNEPFGINLSVFPITNHLGNTLEPFVLHKNDRMCAN